MNMLFGSFNGTLKIRMFANEQGAASSLEMMAEKMDKRTDRRTARTRQALHDALISLVLRKGYDALTIQEIIDEANVGRATFYAHYTGKQDLLRSGFEALRAELTTARRNASAQHDVRQGEPLAFSLAMLEHAYRYKDVYRALVGRRGGVIALNEIRNVLSGVVREELSATRDDGSVSRELTEQFVVGAFLTVLAWWLERRPKLTPTQVDVMFRGLVIRGVGPLIGAASHHL